MRARRATRPCNALLGSKEGEETGNSLRSHESSAEQRQEITSDKR